MMTFVARNPRTGFGLARLPVLAVVLSACLHGATTRASENPAVLGALKRLNVEDLMNIEVTSVARRPEKLLGAASAIQVITQNEIRRSGATTLAEALRLAENLQVAHRGSRGWAVSARGFNTDLANKLLVMIDGRTVYTPLFSGVYWEAQDYLLEDIDRIEVVSGPGGTLWGANAVNGVINVITRSASETQGVVATAGAGPELDRLAALRYGGATATGLHYRVFAKHFARDDSRTPAGGSAEDAWHRSQAGFRMDSGVREGELTLHGDYYTLHDASATDDGTRMRGANLLGRWTRRFGEDSDLSLQSYVDWTLLSLPVGPLTINGVALSPAGRLRDDLKTFDLDFQHRLRLGGAQQLIWGLGFRHTHNVIDNAPALAVLPAKLDQQLFSAFVQDELRLRENLLLTLGTKLEHTEYTGFEFEPSVRLQWQVTAAHSLWSAVSRAIRAPSRVDRDLLQAPPPYLTILRGDQDFESENVLAYELGYRGQHGQRLTTSVSTYYNEYTDVRSTGITPVTLLPFFFENNLYGHTWGAELTAAAQITPRWSVHAGYNLIQQRLRVKAGAIDISNGRNETSDPQNQASLRSSLDLPGNVEVDVGLRWVDTLRNNNGPNPGSVPSYFELEARLAWHVSAQLELSLTGQNLLHGQHVEYGFPSPTRSEAQRSVYGKLAWRP